MWGARGVAKAVASAAAKAAAATVTPGASTGAAAEAVTTVASAAMDTRPAQWQPNCPNESRKNTFFQGQQSRKSSGCTFLQQMYAGGVRAKTK